MLDVASPPAQRLKAPTWGDPRLLGGVLLILLSLVVGARVVTAADKTTPVYAAAADLPAGHVVAAADLQVIRVRLQSVAPRYVNATAAVTGRVVTRDIRSGELVLAGALVASAPAPFREMSVSVKPDHIASSVQAGSTVDVIATAGSSTGGARTWTVGKGLEVLTRAKPAGGFASSESRVVLKVPAGLVLAMTAAMRSAEIDVVRVPTLPTPGDIGNEAAAPAVPAAPSSVPAPSSAPVPSSVPAPASVPGPSSGSTPAEPPR